jgi:hypothetical protein
MSVTKSIPGIYVRAEFEVDDLATTDTTDVALPLSFTERLWNENWVRKLSFCSDSSLFGRHTRSFSMSNR